MLIDWFTVIAQAVNFLVLVWLLRRYLYGPILAAIDARTKSIAATQAEAEAKQTEAQAKCDEFGAKEQAFDQQRAGLLQKAGDDANAERERLLTAARKDVDATHLQWQDSLRSEQSNLDEEIVRQTKQGVFDIARKTLAELATTSLESCMCDAFIGRLRGMNGVDHDVFASALKESVEPVIVRSAFDLPPEQCVAIKAAISDLFAAQPQLRFESAPNVVSGIELTANGQKIAWSIADYLATLQKSVNALVEEKAKPEVKAVIEVKPPQPTTPEVPAAKSADGKTAAATPTPVISEIKPLPVPQLVSK